MKCKCGHKIVRLKSGWEHLGEVSGLVGGLMTLHNTYKKCPYCNCVHSEPQTEKEKVKRKA
jgi:hypothetical protein